MDFTQLGSARLTRARVLAIDAEGTLLVLCDGAQEALSCELLSNGLTIALAEGDAVLVWVPPQEAGRGVILGRIGPAAGAPDELVLEARQNLTIQCGEGSITFRKDGRILIKGRDLVSRAQRNIRLKGGSVALN